MKRTDVPMNEVAPFVRPTLASTIPKGHLSWSAGLFAFAATKKRAVLNHWRRHLIHETVPKRKISNEKIGSATFVFLSAVAVVACIGTAVSSLQTKSLKSDIAALRSEIAPIKGRLEKLEQLENKTEDFDRGQSQNRKNRHDEEINDRQAALHLSLEDVQLIKSYIKLASSVKMRACPSMSETQLKPQLFLFPYQSQRKFQA